MKQTSLLFSLLIKANNVQGHYPATQSITEPLAPKTVINSYKQNNMKPWSGRKEPMNCMVKEYILDESEGRIQYVSLHHTMVLPSRPGSHVVLYLSHAACFIDTIC